MGNDINNRPSDDNPPYLPVNSAASDNPGGAYVRHRRLDRYSRGGEDRPETASQTLGRPLRARYTPEEPEKRAPQKAGRSTDGGFVRQRPNNLDSSYLPAEERNEPERKRHKWPVVVLILLAVIALAVAGLYTVLPDGSTGIIGQLNRIKGILTENAGIAVNGAKSILGIKPEAPPDALTFEAASTDILTDNKVTFTVTTTKKVDGMRVIDAFGNVISSEAKSVNPPDDTTWAIYARFSKPYTGDVSLALHNNNVWRTTDKRIILSVTSPTPVPSATPEPSPSPEPTSMVTPDPFLAVDPSDSPSTLPLVPTEKAMIIIPVQTQTPEPTAKSSMTLPPTPAPTVPPTAVPTPEPTDEPTPEPTPEPTAMPTFTPLPTNTPMPALIATAAPDAALVKNNTDTVYVSGERVKELQRKLPLNMPAPDNYVVYKGGVFAFRGDSFRRNAAFGTVNVERNTLSVLWKTQLGSLRTAEGTLYGIGWTGQPAIIKWAIEVRNLMNLTEEKKGVGKLKEVIFAAQDGKVYFLDLNDGVATRDPIDIGYPLRGSVAVDPSGRPMLAFGQAVSKLSNKTGDIGFHLYNLLDQKELLFRNGRQSKTQSQYTTNGAFDGSALFDRASDSLIIAGENGLLYTVALNPVFDYVGGKLEIAEQTIALKTKSGAESDKSVGVESSVAVYGKYIFMADTYGILRCVDSDTMATVWAFDAGDNTDAAIALDFDGSGALGLYTGNTAFARLGSKNDVTIRRLDAMTGAQVWSYKIKSGYDKDQMSGCKASPVIGQNSIRDLVIFTVNQTETGSSVIAFDKATGTVVWNTPMTVQAVSSPVAVYNEAGDAWIIQADMNGRLYLMNARTGAVLGTLDLNGKIQGSPAVYNDVLVIGTCGKDNAYMYGIRIE